MTIKVINGYDGDCAYKEAHVRTVSEYCEKFGYEFVSDFEVRKSSPFKKEKGYWWLKQYMIEKHLPSCDWLLWLDTDTIAINFSKPLESLTGDFDVFMKKEDMEEAGVMLFRNSEWTRSFIELWKSNTGPAWNDNDALKEILAADKEIESHFRFAGGFDFTVKHPHFYSRNSETIFLHASGCSSEDKVKYMNEYAERFNWRKDCYASFVNMDHRTDRLNHMNAQLARIGLKAERTRGLLPSEVDQPAHKLSVMQNRTPGAIGCHYSQVSIIEKSYFHGKSAMVMEDDLVFCSDFNERMDYAENFLNSTEWDILWLGGTYHRQAAWHRSRSGRHTNPDLRECHCRLDKDWEPTRDKRIVRTYGCWSTYGYIINYKSIPGILELLDQNVYRSMGIDWLFILLQPQLKTFAFVPGMVKQYDNMSDIGQGITYFSGFKNLGAHWYADKMEDYKI